MKKHLKEKSSDEISICISSMNLTCEQLIHKCHDLQESIEKFVKGDVFLEQLSSNIQIQIVFLIGVCETEKEKLMSLFICNELIEKIKEENDEEKLHKYNALIAMHNTLLDTMFENNNLSSCEQIYDELKYSFDEIKNINKLSKKMKTNIHVSNDKIN